MPTALQKSAGWSREQHQVLVSTAYEMRLKGYSYEKAGEALAPLRQGKDRGKKFAKSTVHGWCDKILAEKVKTDDVLVERMRQMDLDRLDLLLAQLESKIYPPKVDAVPEGITSFIDGLIEDINGEQGVCDLELEELKGLIGELWPQPNQPDRRAIETAVKILSRRAKLLGLDEPALIAVSNKTAEELDRTFEIVKQTARDFLPAQQARQFLAQLEIRMCEEYGQPVPADIVVDAVVEQGGS